jgi:hypothetical protein
VYDRDENMPSTVFQLAQCVGDYNTGGWMFDMEMQAEASLSEIRDRALVVLFAEDWYGTTKQAIGPIENRENIVCVGRIVGESIRWDRETGRVHFTVQGAHHWMGKTKAFPVEMYFATDTPDSWSLMPELTVDRTLFHILYWHSTVIETMDFYPTEDTRLAPDGKTLASNLWGQLQDIAISRIMAAPGVDRFGRLFTQIDPQMVPEADRNWATVMTITDGDFIEGIDFQRVVVNDVSLITLTSQMTNASGGVSVLYSLAPGHVPRKYGEPEQADRLLAETQAQSNEMAGLLLGWRTNEFPEIPIPMGMNNRMIDMWPHQFCVLEIATEDTPREVAFDGNLIPRRVSLYFDGDAGWMHSELNFEAETFEAPNTDGDIPDVEDASVPPFPNINFPPLPDLPPLFPGDSSATPEGPPVVLALDSALGILLSQNFNSDSPTWRFWNTGIASADIENIRSNVNPSSADQRSVFFVCPNGAVYVGIFEENFLRWMVKVYRAPFVGGTFVKVLDQATLDAMEGTNSGIVGMGFNPTKSEEVALIIGSDIGGTPASKHFWLGSGTSWTQKTAFSFNTNFMGNLTFGANKWVWDANTAATEYWKRFNADGSTLEYTSTSFGQGGIYWHARAGTSAVILKSKPPITGIGDFLRSEDNGDTWYEIDLGAYTFGNNLAVSYDSMWMMGHWDIGVGDRGQSADGGFTWVGVPNLVPGGMYCWAYAGGVGSRSRWIAARGMVRYSADFGLSWVGREGNLPYIVPVNMKIIKLVVPGI